MLRAHPFAVVLGVAANVEDLHIVATDSLEQMRVRRECFRARLQREISRRELSPFRCQLCAGGLECAVEHPRFRMSRVFERPRAARCAHSGFILVKHDGLVPADSERREYPLQLRAELRDAALGGVGMMKRERIEMARAFEMPGAEILG